MRQEVEARGALVVDGTGEVDVYVVNTCTVTNKADAEARRFIRRINREMPDARVVVAGCSAALRANEYANIDGVEAVVPGHDPAEVANATGVEGRLVQLGVGRGCGQLALEPIGGEILLRREGATRAWLKIQDGCDRRCSFCATRLARGASRSREIDDVVREALQLATCHPELVLTGIHIGHYGRDLETRPTLSQLLAILLDSVPRVRFRLGSIEATEVDDLLLELIVTSGGRVAPHLHMPLQSGSDSVLRQMRRWHTREAYRRRAMEIATKVKLLGLGADVITGFPGETEADHRDTVELIEELPFTYLHVFPFSRRDDTVATELPSPVPQRVARERGRELRELAKDKGYRYRTSRSGQSSLVTLEANGHRALTEDYLRVEVAGTGMENLTRLHRGVLRGMGEDLYIELAGVASPDVGSPHSSCLVTT